GAAPPDRPRRDVPPARGARPRPLARARRVRGIDAPPRGRPALRLLRGAADRQRPAGLPPRPLARLQGHLPPLQDDAGPPRRAQGRLGLPRAAGRDRRREAARLHEQGRHRAVRDRRVQPEVPRVGVRAARRVERADRAHRLLGRPRRRLPHARHLLRRVGLVGAEGAVGQGAALRGQQGRPVLHARRHGALLARGRAGVQGRRGPERLRALPARGRRRAADLDDDAVDARLQRRGGRRPRPDLRARAAGRGDLRARRGGRRARARRGGRDRRPLHRSRARGPPLRGALPVHPLRGLRPQGPHRPAGRLRLRRRRHGDRAHGRGVRRGRLPPRRRERAHRREPRPPRRDLRRADRPVRRPLGQGRRRRPHRGPPLARPAPEVDALPALLPALLALRDAAHLLREAELVHRHPGAARQAAGRQRDGHLAPAAHQARALRQVAREQRRLGDLARALLGHAAARVAQRRGGGR
ncbi:MAG: Isoleucyl-tRNA synthetase, partial [uncultured Solirubrobacteraceae bacterium]